MMIDLEAEGLIQSGELPIGTGRVRQNKDGTFTALVCVCDGDGGIAGYGATEGEALAALQVKIKALGNLCSAAFCEAEGAYKVRARAEAKAEESQMRDALQALLGGGGGGKSRDMLAGLPQLKKGGGSDDGGNLGN